MSKEDPRLTPAPRSAVPRLLEEGAAHYNAGRYWDAHEAWEEAWHALRAAGEQATADYLQGMILATAGLENLKRGKEEGFKRQFASALHRFRTHRGEGARLGLAEEEVWREALTDLYLDACRHRRIDHWANREAPAPVLRLRPQV
ncbi:MAG TPA: DUF309 domain-containing protein [Candidatus Thermoplasmatota archaeon]|nr:DUF309 domain-containing protein [Candidatus Thermoplasmatota archaeon]